MWASTQEQCEVNRPCQASPHSLHPFLTLQMVTDLAGYHPFPWILHYHLRGEEGGWEQVDNICPVPSGDEGVTIKIDGMDVYLIPHPKQVPGHRFTNTHLGLGEVSKKESIEGCKHKHTGGRHSPADVIRTGALATYSPARLDSQRGSLLQCFPAAISDLEKSHCSWCENQ